MVRILGIGCGFLAFGGFCLLGLSFSTLLAMFSPAAAAANSFLDDVSAEDWASARARMNEGYQSTHTASELGNRVQGMHELADHTLAFLVSTETHEEGHVTVDGTLYGPDGASPVAFELTESGDYWYIDLVAVSGRPLE